MHEKKVNFLLNTAIVVVVLLFVYVLIQYAIPLLLPFLIALLVALLVQRPIVFLSKKLNISRKIVAPIITLIVELLAVGLVVLILYRALVELGAFVSKLPSWFSSISPSITAEVNTFLNRFINDFSPEIAADFGTIFQDFTSYIQTGIVNISVSVVNWAATQLSSIPSLLLTIVISLVATFFLAGKTDQMRAALLRQLPAVHKAIASDLYRSAWNTLWRMVRSYLLIMCITFCELALGLFLLGVDYFLLIAALVALVDLLPILGTGTVLIPWGLICLIIGDTKVGVGLLILYVVITIIRNIIEPKLVSRQIGLNPVLTLIGMYVGLNLFGILGLFLIPVLIIFLKSMNDAGIIHIWKGPETESPVSDSPDSEHSPAE